MQAIMDDKTRILAAAETPLHLLNLIALLSGEYEKMRKASVTLAIYNNFGAGEVLANRLRATGLFEHVCIIQPYYREYQQYRAALVSLVHAMSPSLHWKTFKPYLDSIPNEEYQYLLGGVATVFLMDLKRMFVPYGETVFYEEGEGSYLGNFVKSAASNDKEILRESKSRGRGILGELLSMLSRGRLTFNARALYLYRPELVDSDVYQDSVELRSIPRISESAARNVRAVFGDAARDSTPIHWIFLGNPDTDLPPVDMARVRSHLTLIGGRCDEITYRPHPRSVINSSKGFPPSVRIDPGNTMWEVSCADGSVTENSVLFGYGSTAQSNPKKMFGLEPYIVSLHRLLSDSINKRYAEETFKNLKGLYVNKNKVVAPDSTDDLEEIVDRLLSECTC